MVIAMAATRKLQGEIDRCLKKVSEGVETFEDIWQKVHNATNTNQKEKYETDLKKEIKKLQRLRDQIKSWIASGEIKDKSTLVETRKLIETQMERFKVVERETKTKAYSKEGLGAAQKLDPTAREREELNNWLAASIDQMQIQMDQFECEIESLLAAKKKRHDKEKQERLDELKTFMDKHKFHMSKLETLLRMLDNLSVDVNAVIPNLRTNDGLLQLKKFLSQVKKIKDDIDYYLESHQEPEFEDNEFLYDDIEGLEEQQALGNLALSGGGEGDIGGTPTSITSGNNSPVSPIHSSDSSSDPEKRRKSSDDSSKVVRPVAMKANHSPSPGCKAVGGRPGTPPKSMGTPNNSSPSSGLSNHVSSLSSLSSSPTQTHQNYQNALNNVKTLSHLDCVEQHNNNSNNTNSNSTTGLLASSPPNTLAKTSSNCVSLLATENGLNCSSNELLLDEEGVDEELSLSPPRLPLSPHGIPNGIDVSPPVSARPHSETTELLIDKDYRPHRTSLSPDRLLSNLSVSSISMAMMGLGNGGLHSNLSNHAGPPLPTNHVIPAVGSSVTAGLTSSGSLSGLLGGGVSVSSQNNSSTQLSQQQQQQLHQMQHQAAQPSLSQSANSRGETPTSMMDIARIQADQQQQILRFLQSTSTEGDTSMATLKSLAQDALDRSGLNNSDPSSEDKKTTEAHIPPLLGVTPLGPVPLQKEHQNQFQMLDSSHYHLPVPADSERMRQFLPRNPYPTPQHYPQVSILHHMTPQHPLTNSDTMEFFQRLSIETLFFIFYYLEGTKAQYLAAKVLKKQSWRFHTKYMMWFQRHEEPKVINEDFEQGTYIYFDIEKWGQRKKDGFVFEYKYLEDRDLS